MAKKKKSIGQVAVYPEDYKESQSVCFPVDEISDLKIGQEVVITIKGVIKALSADNYMPKDEKGRISIEVSEKKFKKTSNSQAEGIEDLVNDEDD